MTAQVANPSRRGRKPKATLFDPAVPALEQELREEKPAAPVPRESFPPPTDTSEALFEANRRLACAFARRAASQTRLPYDDLLPSAYIGLLRACRLYDPAKINPKSGQPYHLSSLAVRYIHGEIGHMLRKNHSSGVRFPEAWRDHAPRVRRLISQGLSAEAVAEQTGFSAAEVREIVEAQSATHEINLDQQSHYDSQELSEDEIDCPEYLRALEVADLAWQALDWSEQTMMAKAWEGGGRGRREIAQRPYDRLAKFATAIHRGHNLPRGVRQPRLDLVFNDGGETRAITGGSQIIEYLEQQILPLTPDA